MNKIWFKPILFLTITLFAAYFTPSGTIDPWKLFSLKKIFTIIFVIYLVQVLAILLTQILGKKVGSILAGFFGGLISSTATAASLAKESKLSKDQESNQGLLIFLSATIAMLFEGIVIILTGSDHFHFQLLILFIGPILTSFLMIYLLSKKPAINQPSTQSNSLKILPVLKLGLFIVVILALSKLLKNILGQSGLLILTFIVSLFEIHGSVIANLQLQDANEFSVQLLGSLLAISIAASYTSKLFLIITLGSAQLKKSALKYTGILFCSLIVSWALFQLLSST